MGTTLYMSEAHTVSMGMQSTQQMVTMVVMSVSMVMESVMMAVMKKVAAMIKVIRGPLGPQHKME